LRQNQVVDVFAPPPQNENFETFWEFLQFFICPKNFIFLLLDFGPTEMTAGTHTYVRQEALHQVVEIDPNK
jgi:hypothetical protein